MTEPFPPQPLPPPRAFHLSDGIWHEGDFAQDANERDWRLLATKEGVFYWLLVSSKAEPNIFVYTYEWLNDPERGGPKHPLKKKILVSPGSLEWEYRKDPISFAQAMHWAVDMHKDTIVEAALIPGKIIDAANAIMAADPYRQAP